MNKKYVFIDLDGTILDHVTHQVPDSAKEALRIAQQNGHEIILTTGRPPCLFYGIDKKLNFHNYIGANGRIAMFHDQIIYNEVIHPDDIEKLVQYCEERKIDLAYEGLNHFALESNYGDFYIKFSEYFNLEIPSLMPGFYKHHDVYQITLYLNGDFSDFALEFPNLHFAISNEYGIDVNTKGGLKEKGIQKVMEVLKLNQDDIIAIGDGFNDIGMLDFVENSVAMGNAHLDVQKHAKFVTTSILNDGLYNAFQHLGLLKKQTN